MEFKTKIVIETANATISELSLNGVFICFTLEDGYKAEKVRGETRIPGGRYEIVDRKEGKIFEKQKRKFGFGFVPWLKNVPNYEWILIHIGNYISETLGCLLVGERIEMANGNYCIGNSTLAFKKVFAIIEEAFNNGEDVFIEIDRSQSKFEVKK